MNSIEQIKEILFQDKDFFTLDVVGDIKLVTINNSDIRLSDETKPLDYAPEMGAINQCYVSYRKGMGVIGIKNNNIVNLNEAIGYDEYYNHNWSCDYKYPKPIKEFGDFDYIVIIDYYSCMEREFTNKTAFIHKVV